MKPKLTADRRLADFLICDFTIPRYVPWELVDLFDTQARERYKDGVTWDHLRELAVNVPEKQRAIEIRDKLSRISVGRRR